MPWQTRAQTNIVQQQRNEVLAPCLNKANLFENLLSDCGAGRTSEFVFASRKELHSISGGLGVLSQSRSTYFTPFAVFRGSLVRCKDLPRMRWPSQLGSFSRLNLLNQLFQATSLSPVISVYWAIKEMEPFNFTWDRHNQTRALLKGGLRLVSRHLCKAWNKDPIAAVSAV